MGGRRPRAGTRRTASAATASRATGTAAFWTRSIDRIHELGEFSRDQLEQPHDRRNHRGQEIRRLVLPRDHRRAVALKLKFRTAKNTFERETLVAELDLKPLNDIDDIEPTAAARG